jgi:hypothetical protein
MRPQPIVDLRIHRLGLVPVLLALVLVGFSLQDRPGPARPALAPEAFDDARAFAGLRPGGKGDAQLSRRVAAELRSAGFDVRVAREGARTIEGSRSIETVVGERVGTSDRRLVVLAHRDAAGAGSLAELSGTAGLLELARVVGAPGRTRHTLTLVSTSGGSGGAAGARQLTELVGGPIDAVLVLGDLAGARTRRPMVVPWSNALGAAPLRLQRTVQEAVRREAALDPGAPRALAQLARFAAPGTPGEQGPPLREGVPAVLLSVSGERGPRPADAVSRERLRGFGRAALGAITALDAAPARADEPRADVVTTRKVVPGSAARVLVGALLLAPLLVAVDAFARLRRRREPVTPWLRWVLALAVPALVAAAFARLLGLLRLIPAPGAPVLPEALPPRPAALVAVGLVGLLGWLVARPGLLRLTGGPPGDRATGGAAVAVLLVHSAVLVELWARNPYAAALFVPAAHLWTFLLVPDRRPRRAIGLALVAAGLVPVAALVVAAVAGFDLGPVEAPWLLVTLVAGGHASPLAWLEGSLLLACVRAALAVAWRGRPRRPDVERPITVRGPVTYAGPGSLGGVESALRR